MQYCGSARTHALAFVQRLLARSKRQEQGRFSLRFVSDRRRFVFRGTYIRSPSRKSGKATYCRRFPSTKLHPCIADQKFIQFISVMFYIPLRPGTVIGCGILVVAEVVAVSRQCHGVHQPMSPSYCAQTKLGELPELLPPFHSFHLACQAARPCRTACRSSAKN
jgi:hypothetical protein